MAPPLLLLTILFLGSRRTLPNATALVSAAIRPLIGYIRDRLHPKPCLIFSNEVTKVAPSPGLRGSDPSRLPGAYDG